MWTLIRNGGVMSMLFILIVGIVAIAAAGHFAFRARRESLGFIRAMAAACLFGTLAATCADVGATLYAVAGFWDQKGPTEAAHILVEGLAESTSPGILGFAMLGVASLLTAVGQRRLAEREGQ